MTPPDVRTTPRARQIPVLLGIATVAWYFAVCVPHAMSEDAPRWSALGNWKMFTTKSTVHAELRAYARVGDAWEPTDLRALFPSTWESGPRYARPSFWETPERVAILEAALCTRDPRAPEEVGLSLVTWPARPGEAPLPPHDPQERPLAHRRCDEPSPLAPVPRL